VSPLLKTDGFSVSGTSLLENGSRYAFEVDAQYNNGTWLKSCFSSGTLIDRSSPDIIKFMSEKFLKNNKLKISWDIREESNLMHLRLNFNRILRGEDLNEESIDSVADNEEIFIDYINSPLGEVILHPDATSSEMIIDVSFFDRLVNIK